jgi:hypothetical protein
MEIDRPEVVAEVQAAFNRYEAALVSNDVTTLEAIFSMTGARSAMAAAKISTAFRRSNRSAPRDRPSA